MIAADDQAQPVMTVPSFWRTSQLYELSTSPYQANRAHSESFTRACTLQNEQISRVRVCISKIANSNDVVQKVVWYLREKADAGDMKMAAVSLIGPLLLILCKFTPG